VCQGWRRYAQVGRFLVDSHSAAAKRNVQRDTRRIDTVKSKLRKREAPETKTQTQLALSYKWIASFCRTPSTTIEN
jgi:hypothetical protein